MDAEAPVPPARARPLPFEDPAIPGFWARVGAMFQLLFSEPFAILERVPAGDGFGAPWRFLLLLSLPALLLVGLVLAVVGAGVAVALLAERRPEGAVLALLPVLLMGVAAILPFLLFLGMLVGGAVFHACLWLWGGTRAQVGLRQTIRAYGYAHAFVQLGGWIPYLGLLVQLVGMVWIGIGLARLHRTDDWRGLAAVFTPLLLVCCGALALLAFLPLLLLGLGRF